MPQHITLRKPVKVVIVVEGGLVNGVHASTKHIDLTVCDIDNLKAEGKEKEEIESTLIKLTKKCKAVY